MASETLPCAVCGASNPASQARCTACGARLESLDDVRAASAQATGFALRWALVAFGIDAVLVAVLLVALPLVVPAYDPQGLPGVMILIAVTFVGALVTALLSPERTYFEPGLGAALVVAPAMWHLVRITDVRELSDMAVLAGGILAVMVTVLGATVGEKLQGDARRAHGSSS
ncbi:MAG: hypothetical protein GXY23_06025 [Myxococcales bacterium]|nr:hypothetical protein [Myxococcales bacterium]